uniref:AT08987p n=1 Tax=Drosophila melanogaster TaxID=7227 RepID=Q8T3R4_DROME|nr:AT08987p [Drosophila melanogaster]
MLLAFIFSSLLAVPISWLRTVAVRRGKTLHCAGLMQCGTVI